MGKDKKNTAKITSIGGQALIEGVMMRGKEKTAMTVHRNSGEYITEVSDIKVSNRHKIFKIPFVRGVFNFVDSLVIGYKTLMRSAELAEFEDEDDEKENTDDKNSSKKDRLEEMEQDLDINSDDNSETEDAFTEQKKESESLSTVTMGILMIVSTVFSMVIAIGLFVYLPTAIYDFFKSRFSALDSRVMQSVCEGILKITIFIVYMALISLMKDIKRVFMYHGAEHKTIFCYENGLELTIENVRKQSRFHPRCGTSFIMLMLIVSIAIAMFIPHNIPGYLRAGIKILLLPVTMGIGYEAIKLAGKKDNTFTRIFSAPGLWVQRISTKEPKEDYMIECAIRSFIRVMPKNEWKKYCPWYTEEVDTKEHNNEQGDYE